ncbi:MAG: sulfatase [Rikenellaceae bacterium]
MKRLILPLATIAAMSPCALQAAKNAPQNVLFILVDDLGWSDLSYMGSEYYESPNIDKLASEGVVFTNAYAACQVSSPSRASILSGLYTVEHGITNFIGAPSGDEWRERNRFTKMLPPEYDWQIDPELTLMPELLRDNGYRTFMAGKWHLGDEEASLPEASGFDINKGGWASGGPNGGYFSPYQNPALENITPGENLSMRLAKETVSFMEDHKKSHKREPFFAYLSFYAVHGPIQTTQEYWSYFREKAEKMGIATQGFECDGSMPVRQNQDNPVYAGLIKHMDDAVGYVLDNLQKMGLDENTLIIFTSDNGGVVSGDSFSTNLAPLRGGKGMQYEGGIRVPLIVKNPKLKDVAGKSCDTPVIGIDYYPTVMEFAGVDLPAEVKVDGVSIMPLLCGGAIAERPLFWHYPHYGNQGGEPSAIIRKGDWKLIYYYEDLRCELYNLAIDISEQEHLNAQYPDKVKELSAELAAWLEQCNPLMPTADPDYSPAAEAKLKKQWRTKMLEGKEKERKNMLSPNFMPNKTWWDSQLTVD